MSEKVALPHPSTPNFLMPGPGEVASLGLLLRTMYLSRVHQKTLYGSEYKVCSRGCQTILLSYCSALISYYSVIEAALLSYYCFGTTPSPLRY